MRDGASVDVCMHAHMLSFFNCLRRPEHFSGWRGEMCAMRAHLGLTEGWLAACVHGWMCVSACGS